MMKVVGVVLAGGLSRRMGGVDKSLINLKGQPLVAHVSSRLAPQVSCMSINANGDPNRFAFMSLPVFPDTVGGFAGPLAGILAGMEWALSLDDQITHIVSVAADTPFFPEDLVVQFQSAMAGDQSEMIALASTNGRVHPVFGLWPVAIQPSLYEFLVEQENRKVLAFVDKHPMVEVSFDDASSSYDPFFNINNDEDLRHASSIAEGTNA